VTILTDKKAHKPLLYITINNKVDQNNKKKLNKYNLIIWISVALDMNHKVWRQKSRQTLVNQVNGGGGSMSINL
jgi:hypothetical protein